MGFNLAGKKFFNLDKQQPSSIENYSPTEHNSGFDMIIC
jgi:hypothetical protein